LDWPSSIGFWLRTWWWLLSPFLVIVVTMLAFSVVDYLRRPPSQRQQMAVGLIVAIGATVLVADVATLAAVAGVVVGRWWHGGRGRRRHAIYYKFVLVVG
jgi:lipopolysaccharide export LptBFGC system permease protein LptF